MKNKKGSGATVAVVVMLSLLILMGIGAGVYFIGIAPQQATGTGTGTSQSLSQQVNTGDVAQLKVYVEDGSAQNTQTKVAVAVYCKDSKGNFIIDGTSSSTSTEISGSTTREETVTCWAFNSTYQTLTPSVTKMDGEVMHAVIKAFRVTTNGQLTFYTDTLATGTAGKINVTAVGVDGTSTLQKMRYKNNNTNQWMPLGGFYFDKVVGSNISKIDVSGSAVLSGANHASTSIVPSSLGNKVTTRSDKWDFVFEINDPSVKMVGNDGNQPVILEQNDYLDSGSVQVTGNGNGCVTTANGGELVSSYAFSKGYYRSTKTSDVFYGYQTDAPSASVISTDITGDTFYCNGD